MDNKKSTSEKKEYSKFQNLISRCLFKVLWKLYQLERKVAKGEKFSRWTFKTGWQVTKPNKKCLWRKQRVEKFSSSLHWFQHFKVNQRKISKYVLPSFDNIRSMVTRSFLRNNIVYVLLVLYLLYKRNGQIVLASKCRISSRPQFPALDGFLNQHYHMAQRFLDSYLFNYK